MRSLYSLRYYLLTSDVNPCPVTGEEFVWAKHRPYYKSLPLAERVKYPFYEDPKLTKQKGVLGWIKRLRGG